MYRSIIHECIWNKLKTKNGKLISKKKVLTYLGRNCHLSKPYNNYFLKELEELGLIKIDRKMIKLLDIVPKEIKGSI